MEHKYKVIKYLTSRIAFYLKVFALFWIAAFILYLSHFILISVACQWYFTPNRNNLTTPVTRAFGWALFYHIGTLAFGAFLLALIWIVQIILAYIHKKVKDSKAADNKLVLYLITCLQCLAACFERILKYISRHAFTQTVLRSVGFCQGSWSAFIIVTSNCLRFGVLAGISEVVMIFGAVFIASVVTLIGHFILKYVEKYSQLVFETFSPMVVRFIEFM